MGKAPPAAPPLAAAAVMPDVVARDAIIAWYRGEFAAANAIIDALCSHLARATAAEAAPPYDRVFAAVHRRRINWIPVIHMQKYFSIADVVAELRRVDAAAAPKVLEPSKGKTEEEAAIGKAAEEECVVDFAREDPSDPTKVLDCGGSTSCSSSSGGNVDSSCQDEHSSIENMQICSDHEGCASRAEKITTRKGFVGKESVKGHMVNVVKGLKLYEGIFMESELARLAEFINELRFAGRSGALSGETFIFFNKQVKGNKKEIIQLGVPIFQSTKEDEPNHIEPIPSILQDVIDHLIQWRLLPESRKPNSCIINFFDEDEYSQPYFKPPHLDNPISTLLLNETTMAFGRSLVCDHNGNYRGSLTLPLKEGSLLVMRGNSADVARHVVCPSPNSRVSITFLRVRTPTIQTVSSPTSTLPSESKSITLFKPQKDPKPAASECIMPTTIYSQQCTSPNWAMTLARPILMLPPPRPMAMSPNGKNPRASGTGVFLPWTMGPKKYIKHLPPRIQRRRLLSMGGQPLDVHVEKPTQIPCIVV